MRSLARTRADTLDLSKHVVARYQLAKNDMRTVQPVRRSESDEKLAPICTWASVCHREQSTLIVLDIEVFIWELGAVDRNTTSAIMIRKVASLSHEVLNHAMESAALVSIFLLVVSSAQRSEIFCCLGDLVGVKLAIRLISLTSNLSSPIGAPFFDTLKKTRGFLGSLTPFPAAVAKVRLLAEQTDWIDLKIIILFI